MKSAKGPGATVLMVEDNLDNRIIYRTILEHSGFSVIEAEDGATGVRLAGCAVRTWC